MNRRSFFTKLGLAAASLAILPGATTYARNWVKTDTGIWIKHLQIETPHFETLLTWDYLNSVMSELQSQAWVEIK